jgi:F-type H+-transporting ATPase subunit c
MSRRKKIFALGVLGFLATLLTTSIAFAADAPAAGAGGDSTKAFIAIAAGFGIALAAFGGALGQGKTASTALDGIARNPGASGKIFVPMILGLALIESLVIYSLIISFQLVGKL